MFRINMLPAGRGDCLWIEYGEPEALHRLLIDGGIRRTHWTIRERLQELNEDQRRLDLLAVTHIDLDHIGGVLELFRTPVPSLDIDDVWFNGWHHLDQDQSESKPMPNLFVDEDDDVLLGAKDGERLDFYLERSGFPWNAAFGGGAVEVGPHGPLPTRELAGGMKLTLLSPTRQRLRGLAKVWKREIGNAKLTPGAAGAILEGFDDEDDVLLGAVQTPPQPNVQALAASPFENDRSRTNGSSIAFLAEYDGRRCLFAADAFAGDIVSAVRRLAAEEGESVLAVDALKVSHHGGSKNTNADLLSALACKRYLFSTDGSSHGHPKQDAVARVIVHGRRHGKPRLLFNYRSPESAVWDNRKLYQAFGRTYVPRYPDAAEKGLTIDV